VFVGTATLDGGKKSASVLPSIRLRKEISKMRILAIMALAIALVGCTGDRVKQGMNLPQERPLPCAILADNGSMATGRPVSEA
jgi:hypothetical protein